MGIVTSELGKSGIGQLFRELAKNVACGTGPHVRRPWVGSTTSSVSGCPVLCGACVARAIISPSFLLKAGVSKAATSRPYIHSKADLSEPAISSSLGSASGIGVLGPKRRSARAATPPLIDWHALRNSHALTLVRAKAAVNGLNNQSVASAVAQASYPAC
jgi:hypothetical protein